MPLRFRLYVTIGCMPRSRVVIVASRLMETDRRWNGKCRRKQSDNGSQSERPVGCFTWVVAVGLVTSRGTDEPRIELQSTADPSSRSSIIWIVVACVKVSVR